MRQMTGQRLALKYNPFPYDDKGKTEYIVGEASLRSKGVPEAEIATLKNFDQDPPDLIFEAADHGKVRIEITEFVPYDIKSEARSTKFLKELRAKFKKLGTCPVRPANIFVSREPLDSFPWMKQVEIEGIAAQIDTFLKSEDFEVRYEIIQEIMRSPIKIVFVPALGVWSHPQELYENNLLLKDITGTAIEDEVFKQTFEVRIRKKRLSEAASDILVMYHGITGITGLSKDVLDEATDSMQSMLGHQGIYIVEIVQTGDRYWVHVITIREHPLFKTL